MRIGHIVPFMSVGGLEQLILDFCRAANRSEFEYRVAFPWEGIIAHEIASCGIEVFIGAGGYKEVARRSDLLNYHWVGRDFETLGRVQSMGLPYLTTLHWPTVLPPLPCVTICTAEHVYEMQPHKDRCVSISNGIDIERFRPVSKPPRERVVVITVCRSEKCALCLFSIMKRILKERPNAEYWIVGNEAGEAPMIGGVKLWGIRRDIPDLLSRADVFVYAPYPGYGAKDLVVMEAMASGLPVVTMDSVSVRESVDEGVTGFLVPFGDEAAMGERVRSIIDHEDLRKSLGAASARAARERFDIRPAVQSYERVYRAIGIAARL